MYYGCVKRKDILGRQFSSDNIRNRGFKNILSKFAVYDFFAVINVNDCYNKFKFIKD